jgi:hypothetical protein
MTVCHSSSVLPRAEGTEYIATRFGPRAKVEEKCFLKSIVTPTPKFYIILEAILKPEFGSRGKPLDPIALRARESNGVTLLEELKAKKT